MNFSKLNICYFNFRIFISLYVIVLQIKETTINNIFIDKHSDTVNFDHFIFSYDRKKKLHNQKSFL